MLAERHLKGDANGGPRLSVFGLHGVKAVHHRLECALCVRHQCPAGIGQAHAAAVRFQERDVELLFESADYPADRGLGHPEHRGSDSHMFDFAEGDEDGEVRQQRLDGLAIHDSNCMSRWMVLHWIHQFFGSNVDSMPATHLTEKETRAATALQPTPPTGNPDRRLSAALWCAGVATFALMYAPQGLLTQIGHDASVSPAQASLLVSAATLGLALSVLPWARFSDRVGRPTAMRYAAATAGLLAVAVPWLPTFDALVAGRFVQGVALGGLPALAMTLLHEVAAPARTAALAGSYVAATSLGGLSGRLLVVPVADHLGGVRPWRSSA